ncbi:MAG TPA: FAD-binding oxidoreductase, partial [Candidatus Saccharibacteria bacterium]|nr:FAD-binding oxidoreductase [Candidatus Saccharibacteria bacterium]
MNKVASYLQSHLSGEVLDSAAVRDYFSTDASVLQVKPALVIYPRSTNDVRKVARFSWQLAEKGHTLPITARGSGTDQTGAAIGKGAVMVFPAHMNKVLELDSQQKLVRVQPGVNFMALQEMLNTHGLFLPPFPASYKYSTIGGAIAN